MHMYGGSIIGNGRDNIGCGRKKMLSMIETLTIKVIRRLMHMGSQQ